MKDLNYYMGLRYKEEVISLPEEEGGGVVVTIPDLGRASVNAWGESYNEASDVLREIKQEAFKDWLEEGLPIPEPTREEEVEYSGKILLRMPKGLHRAVAMMASTDGISLNSCINILLSKSLTEHDVCSAIETKIKETMEACWGRVWPEVHHVHHHHIEGTPSDMSSIAEEWARLA